MTPTHLDAHMGAAMLAELLPAHVALAREYGLFPVLPRSITWPPDLDTYRATVAALDAAGLPVVDHCRGTLPVSREQLASGWERMIGELPDGTTHFALHATTSGEIEAIAPDHAEWRTAEYALLASGAIADELARRGIALSGYRELLTTWRTARL